MISSRRISIFSALLLGSALTACGSSSDSRNTANSARSEYPRQMEAASNGYDNVNYEVGDPVAVEPSVGARTVISSMESAPADTSVRGANRVQAEAEFREAERNFKEALAIAESNEGPNHPRAAKIQMALAQLNYKQGRWTEAEQFFRRAIKTLQQTFGDDDPRYARALNNLAAVLYRQDRHADAESLYKRALEIFRSQLGANHPYVGQTLTNLGKLHQARFAYGGEAARRRSDDPKIRLGARSTRGAKGAAKNAAAHPAAGRKADPAAAKIETPRKPKKKILIVDEGGSKIISAKGNDAASADMKKLSYSWDLDGDGRYETKGQSVKFDASKIDGPHSRVLKVRVSDDDGGFVIGSVEAQIRNVAPTADAGGPYQVGEGASIEVTATGNDPSPDDRENLRFAWDLDGDGLYEATGKTVRFNAATIDGPKPVEIRLRVTDDDGGVGEATAIVVVANLPPEIEAQGKYVVPEGSTVTLRTTASDPSPADARNLTFAWDLDGDGGFETRGMTATFDAGEIDGPRKIIVRVRVTDNDGGAEVRPIEVNVTNVPPSLKVGGPYQVDEGGAVTLSAEGDDESESDRGALKYSWDLDGDGTFEVAGRTAEFDASAFDGPVAHVARVKVVDDDGGSKVGDVKIAVRNLPPILKANEKFVVDEGGRVNLRIPATDPSPSDARKLTYEWDLDGDGEFETSGVSPVFDATGIDGPTLRRVKVRVSDDDGGIAESEIEVRIRNVAPSSVTIQIGG